MSQGCPSEGEGREPQAWGHPNFLSRLQFNSNIATVQLGSIWIIRWLYKVLIRNWSIHHRRWQRKCFCRMITVACPGGVLWVLKHPARTDPKKKEEEKKEKEREGKKRRKRRKERKQASDNEKYLSPPTLVEWISNIPPWAHTSDAPTILGLCGGVAVSFSPSKI